MGCQSLGIVYFYNIFLWILSILKANQNFQRLMDELSGTENRLSVERRRYNENVKVYNRTIRRFPHRVVASRSGFEKQDYFKVSSAAKQNPSVSFD